MKKILALAFSLGVLTTVFGQSDYHNNKRDASRDMGIGKTDNRDVYNNNTFPNDNYSFSVRDRDAQIGRIQREFDYKILAVQRDRYLRNGSKRREIRMLEMEKSQQISQVMQRFSNQKTYSYNNQNGKNNDRYGERNNDRNNDRSRY